MLLLTQPANLDLSALALDPLDILLRLLCAMVVGMVIGMEREYTHRPAGLRTHILVSLGACVVMITGQLVFSQYRPYGSTADPARLAAQVISGVGFLGAGTIMREGVNVKGLTTAASLWATACLGVAAGGGYYEVALIGMVLMFITLTLLEVIQNLLLKGTRRHNLDYIVVCTDVSTAMNAINQTADLCSCKITDIRIENKAEGNTITFHAAFGTGGLKRRQQRFMDIMVGAEGVLSIEPVKEAVNV